MHTEPGAPPQRPYVLLSCAMSIDGCLDAPGPQRLILSGDADLDRVDEERAEADAIMVGAATIRRDNPRLLIRSAARRAARITRDLPEHPTRVTLTASGDLDPGARFFAPASAGAVVYCAAPKAPKLQSRLNELAQVIPVPPPVGLAAILADLSRRGVHRLLVEGGARLGREFLAAGLVDELALAIAPFFVGAAAAPRFAGPSGPSRYRSKTISSNWRTSARCIGRPGPCGYTAGPANRGAAATPTKNGATARASSSTSPAARNSRPSRAPPSTSRRRTPRRDRSVRMATSRTGGGTAITSAMSFSSNCSLGACGAAQ